MFNFLNSLRDAASKTATGVQSVTIQLRYEILLVLVVCFLGYAFGRYAQPAKVVTKTNTVIETVTVDHVDVKTVVQEVDKPDGTKVIDTTTTDTSTVDTNISDTTKTSKVVTNTKTQWRVDAALVPQLTGGTFGPLYGVSVERRILGPIWAGVSGNTSKQLAVQVGIEF